MKPDIVDIEPDTSGVGPSDTGGLMSKVIASDGQGFRAILDEST